MVRGAFSDDCGAAAVGRSNMESMVGRSAAPKGVERKSEGRSCGLNTVIGEVHGE